MSKTTLLLLTAPCAKRKRTYSSTNIFVTSTFSTKYARWVYAASVREFNGVSRHWKALLGCGVVTLIVFVYSLRYHSSWPLIIWVILLACLFPAAFLAWRDKK